MTDIILFHVLTALTLIQIVRLFHIDMKYKDELGRDTERNRSK